jgi:hypothetical protein
MDEYQGKWQDAVTKKALGKYLYPQIWSTVLKYCCLIVVEYGVGRGCEWVSGIGCSDIRHGYANYHAFISHARLNQFSLRTALTYFYMFKEGKVWAQVNDCESYQGRFWTLEFVVEHMNIEALKILYCIESSTSLLYSKRVVELVRGLKIRRKQLHNEELMGCVH